MTEASAPQSEDGRWLDQADRILAHLGFELVEPDKSRNDDTSHLLVAIRPQPTLQHFDPERVDYWLTENAKGKATVLDRESRLPLASAYSWGRIALNDRMGVKNEFLSFGGAVRAQMTADATLVADFGSHAPILRWAGHSQMSDPLSAEVGAFFARVKVPIDFAPGAEALIAQAAPTTLYCAFVQFEREQLAQARGLREANRWLTDWSAREAGRMQAVASDHWSAAMELRKQLSAIEAIARE